MSMLREEDMAGSEVRTPSLTTIIKRTLTVLSEIEATIYNRKSESSDKPQAVPMSESKLQEHMDVLNEVNERLQNIRLELSKLN